MRKYGIYTDIVGGSEYRIFANSFRGKYSFLNLTLCTVLKGHGTYRCGNYSRGKLFKGGNYSRKYDRSKKVLTQYTNTISKEFAFQSKVKTNTS